MLSVEIVVKKLSRAAVANDESYKFFTDNLNKKLLVRSIDFDTCGIPYTEHGIFHIVVYDGEEVHVLFTYHNELHVDFELYLGGNRIWPKQ